jgi:5-formyltetrahydrofolate cyclo-ligase
MISKAALRKQLLTQRHRLSTVEVLGLSRQITDRVIELVPWQKIRSLHCYVPIAEKQEIDTNELFRYAEAHWPQVQVVVPKKAQGLLMSVAINVHTKWHRNAVSILEPISKDVLPTDYQFDVIVVPTLGFNKERFRIGYGGGYYDKFLAAQPNALTIGLCYDEGLVEFEPEPHDVPLKFIVTDRKLYQL